MDNQATILIVDDEEVGRQALEGVLFSQGFNLIFAQNGKEALEKAQEQMPDLILLDVMMPNMDGFEVCQRMRSDPLLAEIPILLVTALDDRVSRIKGIEAGADDFISKPFDRIELRARVRTVTRLNRYRRLLMERARFVWVTEQAREGYVILNAKDQIKYANPAARLLLSLPAEACGQEDGSPAGDPVGFSAWVSKQFLCQPEDSWARWHQNKEQESVYYLIRSETDMTRPVWLQVEVLNLPVGEETNRLLRINEVSEKLALYQEVSNFHKTILHKLRTPLSNMVMAAELFRHQVRGKVPEQTQELTELVLLGAKRIQSEVEEVLTYLNLPAVAKNGSRFCISSLDGLVIQSCKDLGVEKYTFTMGDSIPGDLTLRLSNRAVEVVVWEIVENARKFHPRGCPTLEVSVTAEGQGAVKVSFRDNGITLPPEQIRQAWMPYYQGEKEFTGEVEGMGLGLSTVSKLVWEVGGSCRLFNRADVPGVIVEITIPTE